MGYIIHNMLYYAYRILTTLIVVRVIISWTPNINLYKEPAKTIIKITDIFLKPVRDILDKYGLIQVVDISPIIAIFILRTLYYILSGLLL